MEKNGTPYYFTTAPDGTPMGIVEDDVPYYFVTNLQGDVVGIVRHTGQRVVTYTYDAWGNVLSITGSKADTLGATNPIRYRGYVYDTETGLYYLQSRYYNPETGRFLNGDGYVSTGQDITGYNMFAYCGNNPSNRVDSAGACWYDAKGNWCHDKWEYIPYPDGKIGAKIPDPRIPEKLKTNPTALTPIYNNGQFDAKSTYAGEDDISVIARMLYGEDHNSMEAHLWVLQNRNVAGTYGGNTFRTLILAQNQFSCMNGPRSLDPASQFGGFGEAVAWDACVDMAYLYVSRGMDAIDKPEMEPGRDFNFTWTFTYSSDIQNRFPDGKKFGGTWFYNK